jgi:myo-inositol-1(or 4)-monophosphatase
LRDALEAELQTAIDAAREAGAEVMRLRGEGMRFGRKGGRELISEADIAAAEMLHERLLAPFPDTGWLSEEHIDTAHRLGCERVWIVDPIDGTREFLQGVPEFAISIGLAIAGRAALGVVHNPASGETFAGVAPPNTTPDLFEPRDGAAPYSVLVGRAEASWDEVPPLPGRPRTFGVGSVAYRLARLAEGRGDVVVTNYGRAEWDVAAGIALCLRAGLRATDVLGEPITFNKPDPDVRGLLVAKQGLHAEISDHFNRIMRRR